MGGVQKDYKINPGGEGGGGPEWLEKGLHNLQSLFKIDLTMHA